MRVGWGPVHDRRRSAAMVAGWAPQGADRAATGASEGRQRHQTPQATEQELTSMYLDASIPGLGV